MLFLATQIILVVMLNSQTQIMEIIPKPSSPCIDAGDPELDLDPDGTRADIGAYP